jgi:hypothetical protein
MFMRIANAQMFYSVPITMVADSILFELGVCQLAALILFEGVAQRGAVRNFDTDEICLCKAAKLCKSGELFLY